MKTNRAFEIIVLLFMLALVPACVGEEGASETEGLTAVDHAYNLFVSEGLSCDCMRAVTSLTAVEMPAFSARLQNTFTLDEYIDIVDRRETSCGSAHNPDGIGVAIAPITGTYTVERIEEAGGSGSWGGSTVFTDGAAYGNMCGPDGDYIVEFHSITNAYSNHSSLRMTGLTSRGTCLLGWLGRHYSDSRVYSDNDIRSCIGYWAGVWCGAPVSGDLWPHL